MAVVVPPPPPVETPKPPPPVNTTPAADVRDWESLKDSRDAVALQDFRRKYPLSPYSEQAARRLEDIQRQQAETARKQKEQSDAAAARLRESEAAKVAEAAKNQDAQAVRGAIEQYAKAFESKKIEAVLAVWPGMSGSTQNTLKRTFKDAKSISLRLRPESVEVTGNSAIAVCSRELRQMFDRPFDQTDKVTIRLKRSDKSWIIDSIQ